MFVEKGLYFSIKDFQFRFSAQCHAIRLTDSYQKVGDASRISISVGLTIHGDILGFLVFTDRTTLETLKQTLSNPFDLEALEIANHFKIKVAGATVLSYEQENNEFHLNFMATDLILARSPKNGLEKLEFECGLINVFDLSHYVIATEVKISKNNREINRIPIKRPVRAFTVQGKTGCLTIDNYDDIFKNAEIMRNLKIPLITANVKTALSKYSDLEDAVSRVQKDIEDLLKITSFVQFCKHSQVFLIVKHDEFPIQIRISRSKKSVPFWLPLTNYTSTDLYTELWEHYNNEIDRNSNFSVALDWYLDAMAHEQIETKFVYAFTALECILAKLGRQASLLDADYFKEFKSLLLSTIPDLLTKINNRKITKEELINGISKRMNELNRLGYADRLKRMLNEQSIYYSDLGDDKLVDRLISLRNRIIHAGELKDVSSAVELEQANEDFKKLMSLLCRIFLRILNYSGEYYDIYQKKVLQFK